jgi:protoporphyrinogen oxidase
MNKFDAVILGAGSGGLAAAYRLARQGARVAVVEGAAQCGGLMRGVRRGEFCLDLGRKELYSRFDDVHALWSEVLGEEYREYEHRIGILHGERIVEQEAKSRGISLVEMAHLGLSHLWSQVRLGTRIASDFERYCVLQFGRAYYEYFIHGFMYKFHGMPGTAMPLPRGEQEVPRFAWLRQRLFSRAPDSPLPYIERNVSDRWRHPARGTGQIVEKLEEGARQAGAVFMMQTTAAAVDVAGDRVGGVTLRHEGRETRVAAGAVISSLPLQALMGTLEPRPPEALRPLAEHAGRRHAVVLVYLMAHGDPAFPHAWLEVNDMDYRVGRVVNYGAFGGDMVPPGKTALCLEYFCLEGDDLLALSDAQIVAFATGEAQRAGLVAAGVVFDTQVIRLPHVNAATSVNEWKERWMARAGAWVNGIQGLYDINRPGTDRAALAGIDAAAACLRGVPMAQRSLET